MYYAMVDITMIGKKQHGHGFANTKTAVFFDTKKQRSDFLFTTYDLSAKNITRKQAEKFAMPLFGSRDNGIGIYGLDYYLNSNYDNFLVFRKQGVSMELTELTRKVTESIRLNKAICLSCGELAMIGYDMSCYDDYDENEEIDISIWYDEQFDEFSMIGVNSDNREVINETYTRDNDSKFAKYLFCRS